MLYRNSRKILLFTTRKRATLVLSQHCGYPTSIPVDVTVENYRAYLKSIRKCPKLRERIFHSLLDPENSTEISF